MSKNKIKDKDKGIEINSSLENKNFEIEIKDGKIEKITSVGITSDVESKEMDDKPLPDKIVEFVENLSVDSINVDVDVDVKSKVEIKEAVVDNVEQLSIHHVNEDLAAKQLEDDKIEMTFLQYIEAVSRGYSVKFEKLSKNTAKTDSHISGGLKSLVNAFSSVILAINNLTDASVDFVGKNTEKVLIDK